MSDAETAPPRPPFDLRSLRAALPRNACASSTARSLAYLARDLLALTALYALAAGVESPALRALLWPLLWLLQGTFLWALFVIGHDCGHGSFSRVAWLNEAVGHLTHTVLLVPYHPWRLSHGLHHRYVGHAERDEAWAPVTAAQLRALSPLARWLRMRAPLLVFPFYLLRGTPARGGSHFDPRAPFIPASERRRATWSIAACAAFACALAALALWAGPGALFRYYLAPWLVFVVWIALVTQLHHTHPAVQWYHGSAWSPLLGALSTVDRRYGAFEPIHHHAGHHVAHHLFPTIPHYRLRQATAALRPVLGTWYRESRAPVWRDALRARRNPGAGAGSSSPATAAERGPWRPPG